MYCAPGLFDILLVFVKKLFVVEFFAVRMQHLRILLYVRKLVSTFAYSCVSGSELIRTTRDYGNRRWNSPACSSKAERN